MWRLVRRRRKRATTVTKHYLEHTETARELLLARLVHFNEFYNYEYNRVAIRNQRRCWGSCTSNRNLNFSYKLLFLPDCLRDYIIVHELCHLEEMNHGPKFWKLVEARMPDYKERVRALKEIEKRTGTAVLNLEKEKVAHSNICATCCN